MKTKDETIARLNKHRSSTPSSWRENAEWRMKNNSWLRYSQLIAMMMLDRMEELGLTQKSLAGRMGCSQQYVSRVLKGILICNPNNPTGYLYSKEELQQLCELIKRYDLFWE